MLSYFLLGAVGVAFIILLLVIIMRSLLLLVIVSGTSMFPTLLPNDRLLVIKYWPDRWLHKGSIVTGHFCEYPMQESVFFIKRLIGLPGDAVEIEAQSLPDEIRFRTEKAPDSNGRLVWVVPDSCCFVKGDNALSSDSVLWGPIPLDLITGVAVTKWPLQANRSSKQAV